VWRLETKASAPAGSAPIQREAATKKAGGPDPNLPPGFETDFGAARLFLTLATHRETGRLLKGLVRWV
jgi:hypothetical protein